MMFKRLLTLLVAALFALSLAGPAFATGAAAESSGVVSEIEGSTLTVIDSAGKEKTIEAQDPDAFKELKVGDRVSVKGDMVKKEGAKSPSGSQL